MASARSSASSAGETEVLRVPARLSAHGLDEEGVDLGERVVARQSAEGVRKRRVAASVVERVPGLVQEPLVVVQPALRAGDEMNDPRRVGRDHARARVLLGPVVEIEVDAVVRSQVEAERRERVETDRHAALLRVQVGERREAPQVRDVVGGRLVVRIGPENALDPSCAERGELLVLGRRRGAKRAGERAQVDLLACFRARDRVGLAGELGVDPLPRPDQLVALVVEAWPTRRRSVVPAPRGRRSRRAGRAWPAQPAEAASRRRTRPARRGWRSRVRPSARRAR